MNLYHFTIGFRAENTRKALREYSEGKQPTDLIVGDAVSLTLECRRFREPSYTPLWQNPNEKDLPEMVRDIFPTSTYDEIDANLLRTLGSVTAMERGERTDNSHAQKFFSELSQACLSPNKTRSIA